MSSSNIAVGLDLIRRHIDYDCYDFSGKLIKSNKSSLVDYLSTVSKNEYVNIPGEKNLTVYPLLSENIIDLIVDLLQIFKDMFSANICLRDLTENDLIVMLDGAIIPKLSQHVIFVVLTESHMDRNIMLLGKIIENTILANCVLLGETEEFLELFRTDGSMNFELIIVHSAIVPICQKINYFCNTQDFLLKFVKKMDSAVYEDILSGLEFPADWEHLIEINSHLKISYTRRETKKEKGQTTQVQARHMESITSEGSASVTPNVQTLKNNGKQPIMHVLPMRKKDALNAQVQAGDTASISSEGSTSVTFSMQTVNNNGKLPVAHHIMPVLPMKKGKQQRQHVQDPVQQCKLTVNKGRSQYKPTVPQSTGAVPSIDPSQLHKQSNQAAQRASKTVQGTSQLHRQSHQAQASSSGTGSCQRQVQLKKAPQQAQISKKKKYNRPGTKPTEEVMRYYRNSGTHGTDYSVKKRKVQYSIRALTVMLLHYFQKLLASALKGLHRNKYLSQMETKPKLVR